MPGLLCDTQRRPVAALWLPLGDVWEEEDTVPNLTSKGSAWGTTAELAVANMIHMDGGGERLS